MQATLERVSRYLPAAHVGNAVHGMSVHAVAHCSELKPWHSCDTCVCVLEHTGGGV